VVERSGNSTVAPGATLEVRTALGQKGMQITEILSVDTSTAQEPARRPRPERSYPPSDQAAVEEIGTVKWYNPDKGSGLSSGTAAARTSLCMPRRSIVVASPIWRKASR
jgi:CspA family cold shock protein